MKRLDFSLHKQFNITEKRYFELRGRDVQSVQHSDLRQPGFTDHHLYDLRTDPKLAG